MIFSIYFIVPLAHVEGIEKGGACVVREEMAIGGMHYLLSLLAPKAWTAILTGPNWLALVYSGPKTGQHPSREDALEEKEGQD